MKNSLPSCQKISFFLLFCMFIVFSNSKQADQIFQQEAKQWTIQQQLQRMTEESRNMNFSSVRQKYFYIYHPLITHCLQTIGEDFEPYLDSILPAGISAASYGFAAGTKLLFSAGILKTGLFGFLKATAATTLSTAALPITLGVGALTLAYNMYSQSEIKQKCKNTIKQMQIKILHQELGKLEQLQRQFNVSAIQPGMQLDNLSMEQRNINKTLMRYKLQSVQFASKYNRLKKYFDLLIKINQK